jgi:hypothetical protein
MAIKFHVMDFVEEYIRHWAKSEGEEIDTLSEWMKSIQKLLRSCIHYLLGKMLSIYHSVLKTEVVNELRRLHGIFVLAQADKASNNIAIFCKMYYYDFLLNNLRLTSTCGNATYTRTNLTKDEILQNHLPVLNTFNIRKSQDEMPKIPKSNQFQNPSRNYK